MAHTRVSKVARTTSTSNPITQAVTVDVGDTVLTVLMKVDGGTDRTGGGLTLDSYPLTQANTTQKAATSPECSAELWYKLNPVPGSYTLTIPNAGALTVRYTVEAGRARAGAKSALQGANGANATGLHPGSGVIYIDTSDCIMWAVVASGAQTWAGTASHTAIANTDDGASGGGEQYTVSPAANTSVLLGWTFGTSEDYGAVSVAFREVLPPKFNNYLRGVKTGSGLWVGERIR